MRQLTPSQIASIERHKSFHAAIAARAVPERQEAPKAVGVKGSEPVKAVPKSSFSPSIVWPVIPVEGAPEIIVPAKTSVQRIIKIVAKEYDVTYNDILSERRTKDVVLPRHIAAFFVKEMTPCTLPLIGRRFGNRDHSTILHAIRKITAWVERDPEFAARVEYIRSLLRA
jgi:hypothetical protein